VLKHADLARNPAGSACPLLCFGSMETIKF
jgi:hypothetical protein